MGPLARGPAEARAAAANEYPERQWCARAVHEKSGPVGRGFRVQSGTLDFGAEPVEQRDSGRLTQPSFLPTWRWRPSVIA